MLNAVTVDVEDWYHVCGAAGTPPVPRSGHRVVENTLAVLALFRERRVRGTFFVLGSVAADHPELVPAIAAAGHEVASHGWSHRLVTEIGPEGFREELVRTGELLAAQSGVRPVGYRAPQWSLSAATPWAYDILAEEGYRYDSSRTPLPFIGDPRGGRVPWRIETPRGAVVEIPPLVTPSLIGNLPTGGGWGFRFFPLGVIQGSMEQLNRRGYPAVIFLHPREIDPLGPRLELPPLRKFAAYGRGDARNRLEKLLERFSFATLSELVDQWESASSSRPTTPRQP